MPLLHFLRRKKRLPERSEPGLPHPYIGFGLYAAKEAISGPELTFYKLVTQQSASRFLIGFNVRVFRFITNIERPKVDIFSVPKPTDHERNPIEQIAKMEVDVLFVDPSSRMPVLVIELND